jgi:hypothetical protein
MKDADISLSRTFDRDGFALSTGFIGIYAGQFLEECTDEGDALQLNTVGRAIQSQRDLMVLMLEMETLGSALCRTNELSATTSATRCMFSRQLVVYQPSSRYPSPLLN